MCVVNFAADIPIEEQERLNRLVDSHNRADTGGPLKPRYHLVFRDNEITFCRVAATNAPTRAQFDELLQKLGIADLAETESASHQAAATLPKTTSDDARRTV
ncbi:MAG: hypothetical protein WAT81_04840 [Candidatus Moraniibacteriota bacterium]